jgi:hypothetical protein
VKPATIDPLLEDDAAAKVALATPPQYQPHNQDQEKKAAYSSSDLGASIVVATSAAGENQNYQHDQDQVHERSDLCRAKVFLRTGVFEIRKAVSHRCRAMLIAQENSNKDERGLELSGSGLNE